MELQTVRNEQRTELQTVRDEQKCSHELMMEMRRMMAGKIFGSLKMRERFDRVQNTTNCNTSVS
jgi:hypothetical protein